jgi:hypothetical protein
MPVRWLKTQRPTGYAFRLALRRRRLTEVNVVDQDALRRYDYRPFRSKHRTGPVIPDRPVDQHRWGTLRLRRFHCVLHYVVVIKRRLLHRWRRTGPVSQQRSGPFSTITRQIRRARQAPGPLVGGYSSHSGGCAHCRTILGWRDLRFAPPTSFAAARGKESLAPTKTHHVCKAIVAEGADLNPIRTSS